MVYTSPRSPCRGAVQTGGEETSQKALRIGTRPLAAASGFSLVRTARLLASQGIEPVFTRESTRWFCFDEKWASPGGDSPSTQGSTFAERRKRREDALVQAVIDRELEESGYESFAEYWLAKRKALMQGIPLSEIRKKKPEKSSGF